MYSLTIHFGPNAMFWSFLFKEKDNAEACAKKISGHITDETGFVVIDDFGQTASFKAGQTHGILLEDMDLAEEARILRSLANARGEIKARQRASTDPVIRTAQQGPSVIAPNFGRQ
jgi:hypothetical protein